MCTCNYSVCSYVQIACKPCTDSNGQTAGLKYRPSTKACGKVPCSSQAPCWQLPCLSKAGSGKRRFSSMWGLSFSFIALAWGAKLHPLGAVGRALYRSVLLLLQSLFPSAPGRQHLLCLELQQVHRNSGLCCSTHANIWNSKVWGLASTEEFCFLQLGNAFFPFSHASHKDQVLLL